MAVDSSDALSPGGAARRPSMNDVAARAGVSYQTVSRVINQSPNVAAATRRRVEQAITNLGYRPSHSARALVTRHSNTIGLIAGGINYYGPISTMRAIESGARDHGFYLSLAIMDERDYTRASFEQVADSFLNQGVEGFIVLAPTRRMVEAASSAVISQPRVILASASRLAKPTSGGPISLLGIDQDAAMREVAQHLAGLGHRSCVFLAGPLEWLDAAERLRSWRHWAQLAGLVSQTVELGSWGSQEAYEETLAVFAGPARAVARGRTVGGEGPTAVVCSNDLQALGVCKALRQLGLDVPGAVSVSGFDDMPGSDFYAPALTTVRPDFDALGAAAIHRLLMMLGIVDNPGSVAGRPLADRDDGRVGTVGGGRPGGADGLRLGPAATVAGDGARTADDSRSSKRTGHAETADERTDRTGMEGCCIGLGGARTMAEDCCVDLAAARLIVRQSSAPPPVMP